MSELVDYNTSSEGTKPSLENGTHPDTWKNAFLAGLPHLIIAALLLVIPILTQTRTGSSLQRIIDISTMVFVWSMLAVIPVMLFVAWRKSWPRWSASYYFYGFVAIASPLLLILQTWNTPLAYRGMDILLTVVYIIILVLWIYLVTRRDAVKGLLLITPVAILSWFPLLEFIPGEIRFPLQFGMFLITAFAAIVIARSGNWRIGIWTIIVSSMLVGIPVSYFRTYHHNIPPAHADSGTFIMFSGRYAQALFWSAMLVIAPLLIWVLWELSKRCARDGELGYRLAFSGLLLNLASNLVSQRGYSMGFIPYHPLLEILFSILIILGAGIYVFGIVKLLMAARAGAIITDTNTTVLFILVSLALPLMFMIPMFDSPRYALTDLPFGLFYENNVPDILVYGIGAAWLFAGGWLVTRLRVPPKSNQPTANSRQETGNSF